MTEDFSSKIDKLKDMLNNEQVSGNLQNVMTMLSEANKNNSEGTDFSNNSNEDLEKIAMITKFKKVLDKKNNLKDPRINLLNAIKPYLNSKRQDRLESFIKILNLTLISSIINEEDI